MKYKDDSPPALYPKLFEGCFDYSPPPGWDKILAKLFAEMAKDPDCRIDQVKDKFGGLRVYYGPCTQENDSLVREAETLAWETCEECGATPAKPGGKGWIRTLCRECRK